MGSVTNGTATRSKDELYAAGVYQPSSADVSEIPNFIDNVFTPSGASKFYDVHDPATNNLVARTPQSTHAELQAAVDSAQKAFPGWRDTSIFRRQQCMFNFVSLIKENWDRLAESITKEQGKTFADAKGDVHRGLQVAETACGITTQLTGEVLEVAKDMETRSYREPVGVVVAICPFNFPAMIPLWSLPIAIITGNCMIIKPSERTPTAALILGELAAKAGFPPGVVNIIHGGIPTVNFLTDHPTIKAISFVGSNRAGQAIYNRAIVTGKRVQANLGAKNHAAVLPDADKNLALNSIIAGAFGAAGQRCMAVSVMVTIGDEVTKWLPELAALAKKLKVAQGMTSGADLGPLISPQALERVESIIAEAEKSGAEILLDGRGYKVDGYPKGNWLGPTIVSLPHDKFSTLRAYTDELFAPILIVIFAPSLPAAVKIINDNPYGNGVALFTSSGSAAQYFQKNIEAGQVGINAAIPVPIPTFSFSGSKSSMLGGNYFYGKAGINFFTTWKTVTSLWKGNFEEVDGAGKGEAKVALSMPTSH